MDRSTPAGELRCEGIAKVYEDGKRALSSVSFAIPTRGIFALIGRNGAGKTTLTRILSTLLEPSSGRATIDGLDIMKDEPRLRERMAVVPQEGRAVPWMSPVQMITSYLLWRGMGYREARTKARKAVGLVGLGDHADKMNRRLSGGMKRKTMVAMVIASGADLIFLDEPSTGLDPISRKELWDLLVELGRERFLFITTHYLEEAEAIADRIGILNDGNLLASGTMDELRSMMRYDHVLRAPAGTDLPPVPGETMVGQDGHMQVMTDREGSMLLSRHLIERDVEFSVNQVTLDDIFYRLVGEELDSGAEGGEKD
ncbi:MAG: ABC transporter ATP-binding protein [Methanomassiliicoccus sp.]|nr:ABC transporter ATP-binding protein [Methanomassiliicoccus sp.]